MKNLIHVDLNSYVIFIYPERNSKVKMQANSAKSDMIKDTWKEHIILITWEELLEKIRFFSLPQTLIEYYVQFETKYLPK